MRNRLRGRQGSRSRVAPRTDRGRPVGRATRRVRARAPGAQLLLTTLLGPALLGPLGCATIASESSSALRVDADVVGARVRVLDHDGAQVFEGATPCEVVVPHGRAFFLGAEYTVEVTFAGGAPRRERVTTSVNEWYLGNALIPGGLVGSLLVDPWTGAMFELDRRDVRVAFSDGDVAVR